MTKQTTPTTQLSAALLAEIARTLPADNPPHRLPATPAINSEADLDLALAEIGYLEGRAATLAEHGAAIIQAIRIAIQDHMKTRVGRQSVTITDRLAALKLAAAGYCDAHRDELLENEKGKTRKFSHGSIAWKKRSRRLEFYASQTAQAVADSLVEEFDLARTVRDVLAARPLFDDATADEFLDVEIKLAMSRIRERFKAGELTAAHRKRLKLKTAGGEEDLVVAADRPITRDESEAK